MDAPRIGGTFSLTLPSAPTKRGREPTEQHGWPRKQTKPKAKGLVKTGIVPQATFGSDVVGLSPTLQNKLDSMAKRIVVPGGFGTCSVAALATGLGETPSVTVLLKMIQQIFAVW